MASLAVVGKILVAITLITAGTAKAAAMGEWELSLRRFVPGSWGRFPTRVLAAVTIVAELGTGTVTMIVPGDWVAGVLALFLTLSLLAASTFGYLFRRGRPCRCYGSLAKETFSAASVVRSVVLVAAAAAGLGGVSHSYENLTAADQVLLLLGILTFALAVFSGARALSGPALTTRSVR